MRIDAQSQPTLRTNRVDDARVCLGQHHTESFILKALRAGYEATATNVFVVRNAAIGFRRYFGKFVSGAEILGFLERINLSLHLHDRKLNSARFRDHLCHRALDLGQSIHSFAIVWIKLGPKIGKKTICPFSRLDRPEDRRRFCKHRFTSPDSSALFYRALERRATGGASLALSQDDGAPQSGACLA